MSDFTFVTYEPGSTTRSDSFKKTVRSRAAQATIPKRRDKDHVAERAKYAAKKLELDRRRQIREMPEDASQPSSAGSVADTTSSSSDQSRSTATPLSDAGSASLMLVEPLHPMLILQPLLSERFSPLLTDFYLKFMAVDIPDLDQDRPGSLRSMWFPFAILHDGLLQIVFLLSGSCYTNESTTNQAQLDEVRPCLIKLKQQALANIRRMIMDPETNSSDQSVAAVTKMASYEAMYGTRDVFDMHMRALRKLVDSRGGLESLGLEGLLARMVCWVDYNSACLLGSRIYFPESNALPKPIAFDPTLFVGGS